MQKLRRRIIGAGKSTRTKLGKGVWFSLVQNPSSRDHLSGRTTHTQPTKSIVCTESGVYALRALLRRTAWQEWQERAKEKEKQLEISGFSCDELK